MMMIIITIVGLTLLRREEFDLTLGHISLPSFAGIVDLLRRMLLPGPIFAIYLPPLPGPTDSSPSLKLP